MNLAKGAGLQLICPNLEALFFLPGAEQFEDPKGDFGRLFLEPAMGINGDEYEGANEQFLGAAPKPPDVAV